MLKNHKKWFERNVGDTLQESLLKALKNLKINAIHKNNTIEFFKDGIYFILMILHYDVDLARTVMASGGFAYEVKSLKCLKAILCKR